MSWLLPSMAPLVPSSAKRKASKCWNWKMSLHVQMLIFRYWQWWKWWYLGLPVEHLGNFREVGKRSFLASYSHHLGKFGETQSTIEKKQTQKDSRLFLTCGGLITNFFFSPATMSGFLSLIIPNTLWSQRNKYLIWDWIHCLDWVGLPGAAHHRGNPDQIQSKDQQNLPLPHSPVDKKGLQFMSRRIYSLVSWI